jgi:pSer/pThr/pTyr-binding forkhead associated (FHA) protein
MKIKLYQSGPARLLDEIVVDRFPFLLGRHQECDFRLHHPMVSRRHCRFNQAEGKLLVDDLHSLNGTYLNGQRVNEPAELHDGDEINVGCLSYRISVALDN